MRALLPILFPLLLIACTPADDSLALQDDYLERLANATEGTAAAPFDRTTLSRYRMPPRRERIREIVELRIGLLDLLIDTHRCPRLQQLIGERNSALGKQLVASRRLAYEGDLLRALDDCLPHLKDERFHATLAALATEKRSQLPDVFWNALNASAEFERYLRFAEQPLPVSIREDSAALEALEQLAALGSHLPQHLPPPATRLDPLFQALQASPQGGQLIASLASLTHTLQAGSTLLEERLSRRPPCPLGKATERGRTLQNIFVKFYAGALQPYLAQVHQRGERWSAALRQLSTAPGIPDATRGYLMQLAGPESSLWSDFERATARHVEAWQNTLRSCGLAPGQSGWPAPQRG
ncbi:DUF3080 domain-containing protein [Pseudomonas indica]|uniref:DUF3080 domain-containing protein n=1 Tax=Pseudomonas indica TaxID=137658 RepID=A0A1G8XM19_9PSED|nr:DUF3080 domain-containing protein [Pseudomonas indica]SDJ91507.1 Protein of unknown function [Pseudomonas indica]